MTRTSNEVKARYNEKTYRRITVNFRIDEEDEILQIIDDMTATGISAPDAVKKLLYNALKNKSSQA